MVWCRWPNFSSIAAFSTLKLEMRYKYNEKGRHHECRPLRLLTLCDIFNAFYGLVQIRFIGEISG